MKLPDFIRKHFGLSDMKESLPMGDDEANRDGNIRLPVEYLEQVHANMCSDAVAAMMLLYKNKIDRDEAKAMLASNPRGLLDGNKVKEFGIKGKARFQVIDYEADKVTAFTADYLRGLLRNPNIGPLGCALSTTLGGHAVLVTGVRGDELVVHDPWKGPNQAIGIDAFNRAFNFDHEAGMVFLEGSKKAS